METTWPKFGVTDPFISLLNIYPYAPAFGSDEPDCEDLSMRVDA